LDHPVLLRSGEYAVRVMGLVSFLLHCNASDLVLKILKHDKIWGDNLQRLERCLYWGCREYYGPIITAIIFLVYTSNFSRLRPWSTHARAQRNASGFLCISTCCWLRKNAIFVFSLSPAHASNMIESTGNIVEATFDFVATNSNNIERFYCKISSFRQSRNKLNIICFDFVERTKFRLTLLPKTATTSKQHSTLSKESSNL